MPVDKPVENVDNFCEKTRIFTPKFSFMLTAFSRFLCKKTAPGIPRTVSFALYLLQIF